jgi:hypothetical protein
MDHPPYYSDLAPTDIWLLPKLKNMLKGKHFTDAEGIKSSVKKKGNTHSCPRF